MRRSTTAALGERIFGRARESAPDPPAIDSRPRSR